MAVAWAVAAEDDPEGFPPEAAASAEEVAAAPTEDELGAAAPSVLPSVPPGVPSAVPLAPASSSVSESGTNQTGKVHWDDHCKLLHLGHLRHRDSVWDYRLLLRQMCLRPRGLCQQLQAHHQVYSAAALVSYKQEGSCSQRNRPEVPPTWNGLLVNVFA